MKSRLFKTGRALLCAALLCLLLCAFCFAASGADAAFEKSISAFPESYRVLLRELHTSHPDWEFTAMKTGLDWNTVINTEASGGRSLVDVSSSYANAFKSKDSGDYNYSTGKYIQKDGGFCTANKFAVSYFIDPRNFLNEENIFQFEQLNFDPSFDVDAIEVILSGSFMYKTKMTYLTAEGESKTINQTYASAIFEAGKTYNVNPCYLAAKIRNEIGATPSGSVTGRNSSYPGIYNFYNIGATDGAGAITRGLAWAANTTAGTYSRPWNTPKKSILGGAEYIASTYIAKGQSTGYLQRFNVNPNGTYRVYEHQYMTNISGAASQGYSTYRSYLSIGLLDTHFIFSIPVFENMPGAKNNSGTLKLNDAANQTATLSISTASSVRQGPSTNYPKYDFTLSPGTSMTVLDTMPTDSHYYDSVLRYPVWYYVRFKYNGETYKGYIPAGFTTVNETVPVALGEYTPAFTTNNTSLYFKFVSLDSRYVTVVNDTKLKFLKTGTAPVLAYDSNGRCAFVNYAVSDKVKPLQTVAAVGGISQSEITETGFKLQWTAASGATGYRLYELNRDENRYQVVTNTRDLSYTVSGLTAGSSKTYKVRAYCKNKDGTVVWANASAAFTALTIPAAPDAMKQTDSYTNSVTLEWTAVKGAYSYELAQYDPQTKSYKTVVTCEDATCSVSALQTATNYNFKVRALVEINTNRCATAFSAAVKAKTGPEIVTGLHQDGATTETLLLRWDEAAHADGYKLYRFNAAKGSYAFVGYTPETHMTVEDLEPGYLGIYLVKAYIKENGVVYYSSNSEEYLATTLPDQVRGVKQFSTKSTCYKLQWNEVEHANGYCVYQEKANGSFKKIATVSSPKALVSNLSPASHNRFQIRAFIRASGKVYWGAYSSLFTGLTNPGKVENAEVYSVTANAFKLKWTAQKGVSGYRIYTRTSDGTEKLLTVTTKNSVKITADTSVSRNYYIRAYIRENNKNYFGAYSDKIIVP